MQKKRKKALTNSFAIQMGFLLIPTAASIFIAALVECDFVLTALGELFGIVKRQCVTLKRNNGISDEGGFTCDDYDI